VRSRLSVPFFVLAFVSSLIAIAASVWEHYGGEPPAAVATTFVAWGGVGVLAFIGGLRGEYRRWHRSGFLRGAVAGLIGLVATLLGIAVANLETTVENEQPAAAIARADPKTHASAVATAAWQRQHRRVVRVSCTRIRTPECAVTYAGPACEIWLVEDTSAGVNAIAESSQLWRGAHATYDKASDSVGCFQPLDR
jgi:hypothetical protein